MGAAGRDATREGPGLAVVELTMIEEEIADGGLARLSPVQPSGPFGCWLDIAPENVAVEPVRVRRVVVGAGGE